MIRFWLVKSAVGGVSARSSSGGQVVGVGGSMPGVADEVGLLRDARLGERGAIAGEAFGGGVNRGPVAEEGDAPVAVRDQMGDGSLGAAAVVAEHAVGIDRRWWPVDEGEREARGDVAQQVGVIARGGHDDQAVDAAREQRVGQLAFAFGVLVGAAGEGHHTARTRDLFDAAVDGREEWVRDVLEDQADRCARRRRRDAAFRPCGCGGSR